MSSITINGIEAAILKVGRLQKDIGKKTDEACKRIAEYAESEAAKGFAKATVDDDGEGIDFTHSTTRVQKYHYRVRVSGEEVAFVEFGAGVTKNGTEPYPEPRPTGIVGIGEYGDKRGRQRGWYFNKNGEKQWTTGTRAQMPMYLAKKKTLSQADKIVKEVFKK